MASISCTSSAPRSPVRMLAQGDRTFRPACRNHVQPGKPGTELFSGPAQTVAQKLAMETTEAPVDGPGAIEAVMTTLGAMPGGGLISPPDAFIAAHRKLIFELAARYRLPAIYGISPPRAAWFPTGSMLPTSTDRRRDMSIGYSGAKSRPISRCSSRPNSS